jgi:hypothetical protein
VAPDTARILDGTLQAHLQKFRGLEQHLGFAGTDAGWKKHQSEEVKKQITARVAAACPWASISGQEKLVRAEMRRLQMDRDVYGFYVPAINHIQINTKIFKDAPAYLAKRELEITSGYKVPVRRVDATLIHELGHALDYWLDIRTRPEITALWARGQAAIEAGLSGYGKTNIKEMIAEGWAEYHAAKEAGQAPREIARIIGEEIEKAYTEKFTP